MTIDELEAYGTERMDGGEIDQLLSNRTTGVLALPAEGAPSMRPLSFHFDGDAALHFVYVVGEESRKAELSERADAARFLVYSMETPFNWRSVLLAGTIERVPEGEADAVGDVMAAARPDLFERASRRGHRTVPLRRRRTDGNQTPRPPAGTRGRRRRRGVTPASSVRRHRRDGFELRAAVGDETAVRERFRIVAVDRLADDARPRPRLTPPTPPPSAGGGIDCRPTRRSGAPIRGARFRNRHRNPA